MTDELLDELRNLRELALVVFNRGGLDDATDRLVRGVLAVTAQLAIFTGLEIVEDH